MVSVINRRFGSGTCPAGEFCLYPEGYAGGFCGGGFAADQIVCGFIAGPYRIGDFRYRRLERIQILYGLLCFAVGKKPAEDADMVVEIMEKPGVDGIGVV